LNTSEKQSIDDVSLLRAVASGDREALQTFYDRHAGTLFAVALKILGVRPDAEDVLQDVFLQAWKTAHSYDDRHGKPLNWLIMLTRSRAIDRVRSRSSRMRYTGAEVNEVPVLTVLPDQRLASREALRSLPSEQRIPIEMAYFGGLTQVQIAKQLRQPLNTVQTRIRAGLLRLHDQLGTASRQEMVS